MFVVGLGVAHLRTCPVPPSRSDQAGVLPGGIRRELSGVFRGERESKILPGTPNSKFVHSKLPVLIHLQVNFIARGRDPVDQADHVVCYKRALLVIRKQCRGAVCDRSKRDVLKTVSLTANCRGAVPNYGDIY